MASVDGYMGASYFTLKEGLSEGWKLAGTCEWQIDNEMLVVRPLGNGESGTLPKWTSASEVPWYNERTNFKYALLKEGVKAQTCESMFEGCTKLDTVLFLDHDYYGCELDTTGVTSMANMFKDCTSLKYTEGLSSLDTSKVTDMSGMFSGCSAIAAVYLNDMDISAVTNTSNMFNGCSTLGRVYAGINFNTDKVTSSENMFLGCTKLVGKDGEGAAYDEKVVDKTRAMVGSATNNGYFSAVWNDCGYAEWSIDGDGKLTVRAYEGTSGTLDTWDNTTTFSPWKDNTAIKSVEFVGVKAQTCAGMFEGCTNLTTVDLNGLDTSVVTDMSSMFSGCTALTTVYAPLTFSAAKVTSSDNMFKDCTALKGGNGTVYSAEATNAAMASVDGYTGASYFTLKEGLSEGWKLAGTCEWKIDASGILDVRPLGNGESGTLPNWTSASDVPWYNYRTDIKMAEFWKNVSAPTCASIFEGCTNLESIYFTAYDTSKLAFDTSSATSMANMFAGCTSLKYVYDMQLLDTAKVADLSGMFNGCSAMLSVRLGSWDISSVTNTSNMFNGCTKLERVFANLNFNTETVTSSDNMFAGCAALVGGDGEGTAYDEKVVDKTRAVIYTDEIAGYFSGSWSYCGNSEWIIDSNGKLTVRVPEEGMVGEFDTWDNVTTFSPWKGNTAIKSVVFEGGKALTCAGMFEGCTNLTTVDLTGLDTSAVTNMSSMFKGTGLTTVDLTSLNTAAVTNISEMFSGCTALTAVPAGFTIPAGATATKVFYVSSTTPVVITYDGTNEAITGYNWTGDNRTLQVVHEWKDKEITKAPTCTEPGEKTQTCTVCGATQTVEVKALGHDWSSPTILFAENGTSAKAIWTCGHNVSHVVVADCTVTPEVTTKVTCTTDEVTTYTAVAKAEGMPEGSATTKRTTKEALEHSFTKYVYNNDATCEADGTETATCDNEGCNATLMRLSDEHPATGHKFTNYKSDGNATCEADGTKTATCENAGCGKKDTIADEGSALGHKWGEAVVVPAEDMNSAVATWTCENDKTHTRVVLCPVAKSVKKAATCFAAGEYAYTATAMVNNETLLSKEIATEKIPATGHHFDGLTCTDCKNQLGDVNASGKINIVDAQMAYDIASKEGAYKDLDAYAAYYSAADVTGSDDGKPDGTVDALDAFRIQYVVLYGWGVQA